MSTTIQHIQHITGSLGSIQESGLSRNTSFGSLQNAMDHNVTSTNNESQEEALVVYEDDEEEFHYPMPEEEQDAQHMSTKMASESEEEAEEFNYPVSPLQQAEEQHLPPISPPREVVISRPSPAQLENIYAAALSGDLELLKKLFSNATSQNDIEPFALANDAAPRTGLTAIHASASRGHVNVLRWLVDQCGGMADLEDREGETALHKASLNGHLPVITYLVTTGADVHAHDADGWTALHNACSKGYLDIVRWLCEMGGAASNELGVNGVDVQSKGGWTPLMNAASKGHLPVVLYLLSKLSANPLIRNNWGETAFDVAAAVFEIWICEVLLRAEKEKWTRTSRPYDPLAVHTTLPVILYENQRLDVRLKTLAMSGGRPKFSVSGLGRRGRRAPFELRMPKIEEVTSDVPTWRSDVQLPLIERPFELPLPTGARETAPREGAERSHFWLSDWTIDFTHPRVDVDQGWQYAHSFDAPDEQWSAEPPPQLERLLVSSGAVAVGLNGPTPRSGSSSQSGGATAWVRRRRWVRVMRRRLDIPPLPFLQPDGSMYQLSTDGTLVPFVEELATEGLEGDGEEMGAMPISFLSSSRDYVARARYLAGSHHGMDGMMPPEQLSPIDARRAIAKLERAVMELRTGMLGDDDADRRTQAEVLLNTYSRDLDRRRLAAGAAGIILTSDVDAEEDEGDDDSDESFHYPGSSPTVATTSTPRPPSIRSQRSQRSQGADYFTRPTSSRQSTDLTPHLSQASEFRVPTHETPQKVSTPRWNAPTPHMMHAQWERDETVSECRNCKRRFTFLFRKHCRRCGRIYCDRCSSHRLTLDPADVVHDPATPEPPHGQAGSSHRVCEPCYDEANATVPGPFQGSRSTSMERIVIDQGRLAVPSHPNRSEVSSQISDLADCPVCGQILSELDNATAQELHVKACLDGSNGSIQQPARYLVYKLPGESTLLGTECVICLEEFAKGSMVARLSCLCSFHNTCLSAWLQRGRSCPVHARDT